MEKWIWESKEPNSNIEKKKKKKEFHISKSGKALTA